MAMRPFYCFLDSVVYLFRDILSCFRALKAFCKGIFNHEKSVVRAKRKYCRPYFSSACCTCHLTHSVLAGRTLVAKGYSVND